MPTTSPTIPSAGRAPRTPTPVVSIGLPVFNGEQYLATTIESLLGQTFRDLEVIISDNASSDRTEQICREFAERDPRVVYVRLDHNLGAAANYNRVFALARGRYFRWSAADDLVSPDAVEKCVNFLRANPGFVLAYPLTEVIDSDGQVIESYDDRLDIRDADPAQRAATVLRETRECNAVFGLIEAEALRNTSLIGRYLGSDHILLCELALRGRFAELRDTKFFRRTHPAASSSDKSAARQREFYDPKGEDPQFEKSCAHKTWRQFKEAWRAVKHAPLRLRDRLRCRWAVLRIGLGSRGHILAEYRRARAASKESP